MTVEQLIGAVEACLFAGGEPISAARLAQAIETDEKTVAKGVELLNERLSERKSALEVRKLEDAYQLCTRREAAPYVRICWKSDAIRRCRRRRWKRWRSSHITSR